MNNDTRVYKLLYQSTRAFVYFVNQCDRNVTTYCANISVVTFPQEHLLLIKSKQRRAKKNCNRFPRAPLCPLETVRARSKHHTRSYCKLCSPYNAAQHSPTFIWPYTYVNLYANTCHHSFSFLNVWIVQAICLHCSCQHWPHTTPWRNKRFFIYKCRLLCACYFRYSRGIVLYLIRFVCSHVLAFGIASSGQKLCSRGT